LISPTAIIDEANRCVACGLCLPHCPTYAKTCDENESPRGRIALMRALASGQLELTRHLKAHLDLCLSCRACEQVCPSQVRYGRLYDATRAAIWQRTRTSLLTRGLLAAVKQPSALASSAHWLRIPALAAAVAPFRHTPIGGLLANLPPASAPTSWSRSYPAATPRGDVALFLGCVTRAFDAETLRSAIRVLNALGYNVDVPAGQGCCGGLHLHAGDTETASQLRVRNTRAFAQHGTSPIVSVASGCAASLRECTEPDGDSGAKQFAARVVDINAFLTRVEWPADLRLSPRRGRIAVHDPCTLSHVLRQESSVYRLLARIPEAEIVPLAQNRTCCGAAGSYFVSQPAMAESLRADKLQAIRDATPDVLASANIGCALFLAAGLRSRGHALEVVHPVTLLARQLPTEA
jgi:glycolate oxidase iron-sulfur subunit